MSMGNFICVPGEAGQIFGLTLKVYDEVADTRLMEFWGLTHDVLIYDDPDGDYAGWTVQLIWHGGEKSNYQNHIKWMWYNRRNKTAIVQTLVNHFRGRNKIYST